MQQQQQKFFFKPGQMRAGRWLSRQTLAAEPGVQCPSPHDKKREPAPESCPLTPNTHHGCHMHHHTPTNYQTKCKNGQRTQLDTSLPQ